MSDRRECRHPVIELTLARLREFYREPEALFWVFVFPILLAVGLGVAFPARGDQPVPIGLTAGAGREAIRAALSKARSITVKDIADSATDTALRDGAVQLIVVPGDPPTYRFDPTRAESRLARLLADDALQAASGRRDAWRATEARVTAPGSRYVDWLVPGLLGVNIMSTSLWMIGYSIVQARTKKLLKRLFASPMRRTDFLMSHLLSRTLFLGLETAALLGFGRYALGVPIVGSVTAIAVVVLAGAVAFGGLGLLVASRAKTLEAASGLLNLVTLPMWVFSGVFFSAANFPGFLQPLVQALPLTALNNALRAVMLDGASLVAVARDGAVLGAWGVISFVLALKIFRWT